MLLHDGVGERVASLACRYILVPIHNRTNKIPEWNSGGNWQLNHCRSAPAGHCSPPYSGWRGPAILLSSCRDGNISADHWVPFWTRTSKREYTVYIYIYTYKEREREGARESQRIMVRVRSEGKEENFVGCQRGFSEWWPVVYMHVVFREGFLLLSIIHLRLHTTTRVIWKD